MTKTTLALALAATFGLTGVSFAQSGHDAYPNGGKADPQSSTAATPASRKHSPGTVGAMKNAGQGSFTASKKMQKKGM